MNDSRLLLIGLFASCGGTGVGNPGTGVDVQVYNESFSLTSRADANGTIDITTGWMSVTTVKLHHGASCDQEIEVDIPAGVAIDLLDTKVSDALDGFDIPAGAYCDLEFMADGFSGTLPADAPGQLAGAAIVLAGSRGDGTPFILVSEQDEEFEFIPATSTFPISENTNTLVIGLDAVRMFDGVDFDGATVNQDGTIYISATENEPLLDKFQSNLDDAAELYDDDDGDGELEPEEREEDDKLGD